MADYLITRLSPGTTRAKIVQFFNGMEHPFFVSSKVDKITGFMLDFEKSVAVHSNQSFPLETKGNKAEPEIIKGPQRLVSGQDIGGQLKCSGPNRFSIQGASSLFRPVGGTAMGSNSSLLQHEPCALNAVDILTETDSGCPPSLMFSSGMNALDSIVKKEEDPNPLYSHDTLRLQPTHALFSLGTHAEALMEDDVHEDAIVATESLIKEEIDDDEFEDPEDLEEDDGANTMMKTHQVAATADFTLNGLQDGGLFKCVVCNDVFYDPLLHTECKTAHKRSTVHSGAFQCDICGKCLTTKNRLTEHLRVHTGERPFKCEICQKSFVRKRNLWDHLRTHTGQKPYECTVCHKSFTRNCGLTRHSRTHTGEKPYECTECLKRFANSSNLLHHRRLIHEPEKLCD